MQNIWLVTWTYAAKKRVVFSEERYAEAFANGLRQANGWGVEIVRLELDAMLEPPVDEESEQP